MKKFLLAFVIVVFAINGYAFNLVLDRDPFMDLLKLRALKFKEKTVLQKMKNSKERKLIERINSIINSIVIKAVFYSKENPKMNAALITGPSGTPIVVYKKYKIADGVYVSKIIKDGIVLSFKTKKGTKSATLKMNKK